MFWERDQVSIILACECPFSADVRMVGAQEEEKHQEVVLPLVLRHKIPWKRSTWELMMSQG